MPRLSINEAWEAARARLAADGGLIFPVSFALVALPAILFQHFLIGPRYRVFLESGGTDTSALAPGLWSLGAIPVTLLLFVGVLAIARLVLQPGTSVAEALRLAAVRMPVLLLAALLIGLGNGVIGLIVLTIGAATGSQGVAALSFVVFAVAILFVMVRLSLIGVVPAAEPIGPVALVRRGWSLTKGAFWRLLAFWVLVVVVSAVLTLFVSVLFGIAVTLLSGGEPGRTGELIVTIASGIANAAIYAVTLVILAEIYRQLAAQAPAVRPER